ncbi:hypothetical protein [Furfurilactobacillus rossiae]|uniref:Phage protein n=1 Tax=Furfurilactobacillus rossiae DSM 15814 TaxID=1114972 RepID=A0A0R1RRG3_9LACO|nr:hypothetical protein [Furfurilactobacillus rossiae]KRL56658.1 hypothetical protein FD35_GL001757 [Furfurilactobacillus rossiae DSM 15814]QFR66441.1 hypothetical protein LR814_04740 [Furfurilactobacillus rossiae]QLE61898.1 Phage protein [Furfurilactobacillus rossiae]
MGSRFEWLQEYRQLCHDIGFIEWDIRKSKAELSRWEIGGDLERHGESTSRDIEGEIARLEKERQQRIDLKDSLLELVQSFDGIDEKIMYKKYVDGETLEQIAEDLNYNISYIRQKHAELHKRLDWLDKWTDDGQTVLPL